MAHWKQSKDLALEGVFDHARNDELELDVEHLLAAPINFAQPKLSTLTETVGPVAHESVQSNKLVNKEGFLSGVP